MQANPTFKPQTNSIASGGSAAAPPNYWEIKTIDQLGRLSNENHSTLGGSTAYASTLSPQLQMIARLIAAGTALLRTRFRHETPDFFTSFPARKWKSAMPARTPKCKRSTIWWRSEYGLARTVTGGYLNRHRRPS
jgi:hypothetical protein